MNPALKIRPSQVWQRLGVTLVWIASCAIGPGALALDLGRGPLPLAFELARGTVLHRTHAIAIEGQVSGSGNAGIVLRVDDGSSKDWGSRFNRELTLEPGPFRLSVALEDLKTSAGRPLDLGDIRRIVLGRTAGSATVTVARAVVEAAAPASFSAPTNLPTGRVPVVYEPRPPATFGDNDAITIEGVVEGPNPVSFLVRLDDRSSTSYSTRVNIERTQAPGPFRFRVSPKGLRTPSGGHLDYRNVTRIILAGQDSSSPIRITRFSVAQAERMPDGAKAYALAAADGPILPVMERIAPGDPRLIGAEIRPVARIAPDPTVATGLRGVDLVRLPWSGGRVRVSLFTEDPGEWEYLPSPLSRSIRVNGTAVLTQRLSPEQWIRERYLRLEQVEHGPDDDAWTAYGRYRGNVVSTEVDASGTGIVIELAGDSPEAKHLSAVVVEPAGQTAGIDFIQSLRAEWFRSNFPKALKADPTAPVAVAVALSAPTTTTILRAATAAGTGAWISAAVSVPNRVAAPAVRIDPPRLGSRSLAVRAWAGERRLERDGNLVLLRDNRLVADLARLPLETDTPRTYELWVSAPADAEPGLYLGGIEFQLPDGARRIPIEIEVLGVKLPAARKPAGFYHFAPAHYHWFKPLTGRLRRQTECDLQTFAFFDAVSGTAPSGSAAKIGQLNQFMTDMRIAQRGGIAPGWLLYGIGTDDTASLDERAKGVGAAGALMVAAGMGVPVWSTADEPSNADHPGGDLRGWIAALRRHAPLVRLGAQLNSKADVPLVPLFDVAIINSGYGLDKNTIESLAAQGRTVWIYNAEDMRLAAGFWLWQTRAVRYVQWHARSPHADPFDPLDGRENDFQMLYPTVEACPATPDVNRDLLKLANGVVDQRWLEWLDQQKGREAEAVRSEVLRRIGSSWSSAIKLGPRVLDSARALIIDFARRADATGQKPQTGAPR